MSYISHAYYWRGSSVTNYLDRCAASILNAVGCFQLIDVLAEELYIKHPALLILQSSALLMKYTDMIETLAAYLISGHT